jgi:hypothetical protein
MLINPGIAIRNIPPSIYFLLSQAVRRVPLPGGLPAGDLREYRGGGLHLRRGVLHQHLGAGQGLHQEALREGAQVCYILCYIYRGEVS